jgi:hypothetical protein
MFRCPRAPAWLLVGLALTVALPLAALVPPDRGPDGAKPFRHPGLTIPDRFDTVDQLPAPAAERARQDLAALRAPAANARIDARSQRFVALTPSQPLIPGDGAGNRLTWNQLGRLAPTGRHGLERAAAQAFAGYLGRHGKELRIDPAEAALQSVTAPRESLVQIFAQRMVGGVPVRDSYLNAVVSHGNLVLLGTHRWGDIDVSTEPAISLDEAAVTVESYAAPLTAGGTWGKSGLILVPMARGQGYTYRLAWSVKTAFEGEHARFEGLVDAHTGELLAFEDTNHYAEAKGGVLPVSNDGVAPDGVEQPGWPMPFLNITTGSGTVTTDSGGNFTASGTGTSSLAGQFIRMNDNCGAISLSAAGDLDFGASGGTDCVTPGFGGAGNTHASRTGFHELNRIKEMARGQLPGNSWLTQQLTSNMNINSTCNAFWNGSTVNFYRSGGGCSNTGELAGVFDHEWGHGLDANDATPGVSNPGEGIADIYTALRLNGSCIGRNFRPGIQCGGYGDPCVNCTGVRDIDFAKRQSGQPHDVSWGIANCGGEVHCRGYIYAEAVWDLWKRDLPALFGMDDNTAGEVTTRLTYLGAGGVGTWYADTPPFGGCSASGGYLNYLAADDDNGNLGDGTPHMTAIFAAFDRHEAACGTPAVQDSGCSGTPTAAPSLTATPSDKSASLSWTAVAGASSYDIFRTDSVFACAFGKTKVGSTAGTSFNDSGLQNGRDYSYVVIPKGPSAACFGPASACATVRPSAGPNLEIDAGSAVLTLLTGDGDDFLDNCEMARMTFDVTNTGIGTLTNVHIVSVTSTSHPSITAVPGAVSPSTLGEGATGSGSFDFTGAGLSPGDTVTFLVEVTADQLATSRTQTLTILSAETDFTNFPSLTWDFEAGTDGWTVIQGTFNRTSAGGGAQGTTWYEQSSANLDNQCDHIRSPILSLNSTSTLSLWNQFDIEPQFTNGLWYDRANVGIHQVASGTRTPVNPDGGRLYNASGAQGTCGTTGQQGWADAATTWGESTWSAGALGSAGFAGQQVQLDIRYGTDASLNGFGFRFDQVTVTNVDVQGPDTQSDTCGCQIDADCDNGLFCDGVERCVANACQPGTPVDCNDGVGCTVDACNEATDSCDNTPDDGACDNGLFCDGAETCDPVNDCQPGTAVNCNDGVGCTVDACNEGTDSCDNTPDDAACDDGLFCNGVETCDPALDCQPGGDPCLPGQTCNETTDMCEGGVPGCLHDVDFESGAGGWVGGSSTCTTGFFVVGTPNLVVDTGVTTQVAGGAGGSANALFTQPNSSAGIDDVDNGTCETLSPAVNASGLPAVSVSLDYFHGQRDAGDDAADGFVIDVLNNGVVVDSLVNDGDITRNAAWTPASTVINNPGTIQLRVRATDGPATGDLVEGGIDNVQICPAQPRTCTVDDDFEAGAPDWVNEAASTCVTGDYVTGDPTNPAGGVQIVGSHSGVTSIFTAGNITSGVDDVDGGNCILGSPPAPWSVATASTLRVWYWHGQRDNADDPNGGLPNGDGFALEYSIDGGLTWTALASNGDAPSTPVWTEATAPIPAGSEVKLRMQCSDGAAAGDLVECGLDDVSICNN